MAVDDSSNNRKFGPPGPFQSPSMVDRAFPVQPKISTNPAHSQLYSQQLNSVSLPDLLATIRTWHRGKSGRTQDGSKLIVPWFALEIIHLDTGSVIKVIQLDPSDNDEDICQDVERTIEQRYHGIAEQQQRFEVRCHFRSDDGSITCWEPFTCCINLPPKMQHYGQPHYSGYQGGFFGGSGYGGPFGSNGANGRDGFGNFNNQLAVSLRANIDAAQRSDAVLFRALDMIENHARRLEAANQVHWENQMNVIQLITSLQDNKQKLKLDEQMAELKMAALQTALDQTMKALPMGASLFNRWLQQREEEKNTGRITPRQEKAQKVLKSIMIELQKNPSTKDPNHARQALMMMGFSEETINDAFSLFQEFYIDQAIGKAEEEVKASLLGKGDSSNETGIKRLLKAVGKDVEESDSKSENFIKEKQIGTGK